MKVANVLSILLTVVLGLIAAQWIISPESAALSLNMPYLEGDARNTQVRDFTAFFLGTSIMALLSFITKQYQWIFSAGIIFLIAAIFNVLTAFNHETNIAISSLIAEIIFTSLALVSAYLYKLNSL